MEREQIKEEHDAMASRTLKKAAAATEDTLRVMLVIAVLGFAAIYVSKGKSP